MGLLNCVCALLFRGLVYVEYKKISTIGEFAFVMVRRGLIWLHMFIGFVLIWTTESIILMRGPH